MQKATILANTHLSHSLKKSVPSIVNKSTLGICSNCDHAASCFHHKMSTSAIHYCEEFEIQTSSHIAFRVQSAQKKNSQDTLTDEGHAGICRNCSYQQSCAFCYDKQNKIFCEEYYPLNLPSLAMTWWICF